MGKKQTLSDEQNHSQNKQNLHLKNLMRKHFNLLKIHTKWCLFTFFIMRLKVLLASNQYLRIYMQAICICNNYAYAIYLHLKKSQL